MAADRAWTNRSFLDLVSTAGEIGKRVDVGKSNGQQTDGGIRLDLDGLSLSLSFLSSNCIFTDDEPAVIASSAFRVVSPDNPGTTSAIHTNAFEPAPRNSSIHSATRHYTFSVPLHIFLVSSST